MTAKSALFRLKKISSSIFSLFAVCCLLCAVFGCGYSLHGRASLPFQAVNIGVIENGTYEPKLQDKLSQALSAEFLSQGIVIHPEADYRLQGKIKLFELRILSETADVATEYEIIIRGDFTITDGSGNIREYKDIGSPFFVSFPGSGQLTTMLAVKELAAERAVRDMARQIVAALIYR